MHLWIQHLCCSNIYLEHYFSFPRYTPQELGCRLSSLICILNSCLHLLNEILPVMERVWH